MTERCVRCRRLADHQHHRIAKGAGGSKLLDYPENLIPLCWRCHLWVHAHPAQALEDGYRQLRNTA